LWTVAAAVVIMFAMTAKRQRAWNELNRRVIACRRCPRLVAHCRNVAATKRASFADWDYWGRPVPNFGDAAAGLLIVGLAPAAHGANRTGRMFTGDRSGDWLYRALHRAGFANQPAAGSVDDGLTLSDAAITAVCHCAPPDNKPLPAEVANCQEWLDATFDVVEPRVVMALGQIAWRAVVDLARRRGWHEGRLPKFAHAARVDLGSGRTLLGSYHPSQQNTFTGRLTEAMLDGMLATAKELLRGDRRR
jgi:uracil-DNA glycosylase family 4